MELPPFKDFMQSVRDSDFAAFDGIDLSDIVLIDSPTPESIHALIQHLVKTTALFSSRHSLAMLEAYHEWLQKHL